MDQQAVHGRLRPGDARLRPDVGEYARVEPLRSRQSGSDQPRHTHLDSALPRTLLSKNPAVGSVEHGGGGLGGVAHAQHSAEE